MQHLKSWFGSLLFAALCAFLPAGIASPQSQMHYFSTGNPFPVWVHCTVTNASTNLAVSGTGCTPATIAKAAALTQSIPIIALPANGFVHNFVVKSSTAFAGTTTLLGGLGTTGNANLYLVSATGYNLNATVAVGNLSTLPPLAVGSDTASATNVVFSLTSTIQNLTSISSGSVDIWVLWSQRP